MRFAAVFGVLSGMLLGLHVFGMLGPWNVLVTRQVDSLINLSGIATTTIGARIFLPNHILEIIPGCTGVYLGAAYASLVTAYPLPLRKRFAGVVAGLVVLYMVNVSRLVLIAHVSNWFPDRFYELHDLFQAAMALVVVVLWAGWLKWVKPDAR